MHLYHQYSVWLQVSAMKDHFVPPLRSHVSRLQLAHLCVLALWCLSRNRICFTKTPAPTWLRTNYSAHLAFHAFIYVAEFFMTNMVQNTFMVLHHLASIAIFYFLNGEKRSCSLIALLPFLLHNLYHSLGPLSEYGTYILINYNISLSICCIYLWAIGKTSACVVLATLLGNNAHYACYS